MTFRQTHCDLTVPHPLWVFVGERRRKAAPLALAAPRVRRRALRLVTLLAVAEMLPLVPLVGQLPVLRGRRHLVGLFHFEEHRRGRVVLHGPGITERGRTFLFQRERQCEDVAQIHYYVARCGWVALNPSHLFLALNLTGVFCSRACSSLGSIPSLSEWLHCLCFCRRTFVENAASQ